MKSAPFILLILGLAFIWLGLTGRLGAVLAAIFEPQSLTATTGGGGAIPPVVVPPETGAPEEAPSAPEEAAPEMPDIPSPSDIFPGADVLPAI